MKKMEKITEILKAYALTSVVQVNEDSVDLMMAHIAGEYEGNPKLEDQLEDDIGRLARYQVGDLKVTNGSEFQKKFPFSRGKQLPEWFFDAVKLEMDWQKNYQYKVVKKVFGYKEAIHFYAKNKPEEVELVSPGFQLRMVFEKDKACFVAEQDFKKMVEEYCDQYKKNENLAKMTEDIKSVVREHFAQLRNRMEDLRDEAKV